MRVCAAHEIPLNDVVWALGSIAALDRRAFDAELLLHELPAPPSATDSLITAARSLGFRVKQHRATRSDLAGLTMPCRALMWDKAASDSRTGAASENHHRQSVNYSVIHASKSLTWSRRVMI
jgi:hypothetical protein